ncbi:class I SAM-dependent methyltransferase [Nitrosomonas sp. PY1]|uniref:class I SAM-dependent methyltransferase n=1 Tax=Nitrosomonas sp. PY1 TaxID=1803906 RepID=UPI001FC84A35|nr:class I SAM-dependent methyltransferase [Nitrosomonas sp. PY1]
MQNDMYPIATETNIVCYLCGESGAIIYRDCVDHLFGAPGKWDFKKCTAINCGHIWLDPRPHVDDIGKAYQNYYTHDANDTRLTGWLKILRTVLHRLSLLGLYKERQRYKHMYLDEVVQGNLLEIGCGNGKRLNRLRNLGWKVTGQEIDPAAYEFVTRNLGISVHLGPLESLNISEQYDVILMSHVIEHVHDPAALLISCLRLLKHDGLIILLTPNTDSYGHRKFRADWRGLEPPRHLHLFNSRTLMRLMQKSGFQCQKSWTVPITAFGIGQNSSAVPNSVTKLSQSISYRDIFRGFWFQLLARIVFILDKQSGEECVLIARKTKD